MANEDAAVGIIVEIPKGSRNKYEYDHTRGFFRLDRVLFSSVHYPTDYGFIPETLSHDGDPLDVLVLVDEPTFTGCYIDVRPVGTLQTRDENGRDDKILAVPMNDPRYDQVRDLADLPQHLLLEIENFFATYKTLEGKEAHVCGWRSADEAKTVIEDARQAFMIQEGDEVAVFQSADDATSC
jgi:inorganic pyrophosphatase